MQKIYLIKNYIYISKVAILDNIKWENWVVHTGFIP